MKVACLGSVRVVFADGGRVSARNDYYAFGKRVTNSLLPASADNLNRHLFNGKERQVVGLPDYLDYGARMYDGETGRWMTLDPLAEKYYPVSPYVYANNNPVRFIDPDGMSVANPVPSPDVEALKGVQEQAWKDLEQSLSKEKVLGDLADMSLEFLVETADKVEDAVELYNFTAKTAGHMADPA